VIEFSTAIVRLSIALAFGAFIGVEREWRHKNAGLKTIILVAVGAAAFAMVSDTFGSGNHNPGQIAAAVVGGIGFIGAGVIMHRGATVQGVTTAATLWASASVGMTVGLGQFAVASVLTAGILMVQIVMRWVERWIGRARRPTLAGRFELRVDCEGETWPAVNAMLAERHDLTVLHRSVKRGTELLSFRAMIRTPPMIDLVPLEEKLVGLHGVRRVEVHHLGTEEE
jgi:putative Mg2+ transporter-C (MgtC) family protein